MDSKICPATVPTHLSWTRNQLQSSSPLETFPIGPSTCQSSCRTLPRLQGHMVLTQQLKVCLNFIRSHTKHKNNWNPAGVLIEKRSSSSEAAVLQVSQLLLNVSLSVFYTFRVSVFSRAVILSENPADYQSHWGRLLMTKLLIHTDTHLVRMCLEPKKSWKLVAL